MLETRSAISVFVKQVWGAPERSKQAILEVLTRELPLRARVLEVASGSGQHAEYFAAQRPGWTWQPSDVDPANLVSIEAWAGEAGLPNLLLPLRLDVHDADSFPDAAGAFDAVFCANMIHIAPWSACEGLMRGVGRCLNQGAKLVLYGPFRLAGQHTSESNADFDESLKARDARWGVRDVDEVAALAALASLSLAARIAMPANNQCLVFVRSDAR